MEEQVSSKNSISKEKYEAIDKIVSGVSRKYSSKYLTYDNNYSQLWTFLIQKSGVELENMDLPLIAKMCWNKITDIYRKDKRDREKKAKLQEELKRKIQEEVESRRSSEFDDLEDIDTMRSILDLFDEDSRERKYLIMVIVNKGVVKNYEDLLTDRELEFYNSVGESSPYEVHILRKLGWYNLSKTNAPGSWKAKKYNMYKKIREFLDNRED